MLIFTAYGLGLTRSSRWGALHRLFSAVIQLDRGEPKRIIETFFLECWKGADGQIWKQFEGLEKRKTPLSDHLLSVFTEWSKRFIGLSLDFEVLVARFELLGSLAYIESADKSAIKEAFASGSGTGRFPLPVGRVGWHRSIATRLVAEIQADPMKGHLVTAGFAKGDRELIELFVQNFTRVMDRMRW